MLTYDHIPCNIIAWYINPLLHLQKYKLAPKTFDFQHQGDPPNPQRIRAPIRWRNRRDPEGSPLCRKPKVFGANQAYFWGDKLM